ncbi:hypothetical protein Aca07nite_08870 [Actinoplanes capillaceus]|uniref:Uncharacterized protein n=1 Tax=Actinoplanes campanulatus TaxID=113559 RepID=A0ABQ3W9E5_9ACTN|nr:hypothetical protein [Actinoplanes capillaceus]GID43612.1 hypothetical protein Aca07nite_08870 [Actinoplanes capillaceus]
MLGSSLRTRPAFVAGLVVATLAASSGAAWALWGLGGSGVSSAAADEVIQLQLTAQPRPNNPLFPGARSALSITVRNDNRFPVLITTVRPGTDPITVDTAHGDAGCTHTGISLTKSTFSVVWRIPAQRTSTFSLSNAITMSNASDSACQGGTFTVPLVANGTNDAS